MTQYARPHLVCPTCDGSTFRLAIQDFGYKRLIADCADCLTRSSIPVEHFDRCAERKTAWAFLKESSEHDIDL